MPTDILHASHWRVYVHISYAVAPVLPVFKHVFVCAGDEWLHAAVLAAGAKAPVFTPQGLSTVVWALATLEVSVAATTPLWVERVCQAAAEQVGK